jgi:hypothetical protein
MWLDGLLQNMSGMWLDGSLQNMSVMWLDDPLQNTSGMWFGSIIFKEWRVTRTFYYT